MAYELVRNKDKLCDLVERLGFTLPERQNIAFTRYRDGQMSLKFSLTGERYEYFLNAGAEGIILMRNIRRLNTEDTIYCEQDFMRVSIGKLLAAGMLKEVNEGVQAPAE